MTTSRALPLRTTHALPSATTMLLGRPPTSTSLIATFCGAGVVAVLVDPVFVVPGLPPPSPPPPRARAAISARPAIGTTASAHGHSRRARDSFAASTVGAWSGETAVSWLSPGAASPTATRRSGAGATGRPAAAASAARPRSPADGKRSSGSFAMARDRTASKLAGTFGARSCSVGGSSLRWAHSVASSLSRW